MVFGGLFLLSMFVITTLEWRRRSASRSIHLIMASSGANLRVRGLDKLPREGCILVGNHNSFLDGPMLIAVLPPRFGFVIKEEMGKVPLIGFALRRMGMSFIRRFSAKTSSSDTLALMKSVQQGGSLCFFPEGHRADEPILQDFKLGAFAIAARFGVPVVPVYIKGTREIMPPGKPWPKPGDVEVTVMPPIHPQGEDRQAAIKLRDATHRIMQDAHDQALMA